MPRPPALDRGKTKKGGLGTLWFRRHYEALVGRRGREKKSPKLKNESGQTGHGVGQGRGSGWKRSREERRGVEKIS